MRRPPAVAPGAGAGDRHREDPRSVPARSHRAGRRLGRPRFRLPAGVARAPAAAVQVPARGGARRPPAPRGIRRGRGLRPAARRRGSGCRSTCTSRRRDRRRGLPWRRGRATSARARWRRSRGSSTPGGIALGHTLDDQAETVLLNLVTGSGLRGLAGIRYAARPWINPLLDVTREEVEAFCRSLGLRPRHDPSNDDRRFLRNALRQEGLPALERTLGRGLREPLARTAATLAEDAEELARQAAFAGRGRDHARRPRGSTSTRSGCSTSRARCPLGWRPRPCTPAAASAPAPTWRPCWIWPPGRPGRRRDLSDGVAARRGRAHVHLSPSLDSGP